MKNKKIKLELSTFKDTVFYIIDLDNDITVGELSVSCDYKVDTLWLYDLTIYDKYQLQGYGTAAIKEMFRKFKVEFIEGISLTSSLEFYETLNADWGDMCQECEKYEICNYIRTNTQNQCIEYADTFGSDIPKFKLSKSLILK